MAKLEIPVVVDIDAVAELIEELKDLQTYKLGAGDDLILVDRDAVVEIFAMHVKAKRREERKTGRWGEHGECPYCGYFRQWEDDNFCANCGARMSGGDDGEMG